MKFFHKVSGNGQGYIVVFKESCRPFDSHNLDSVNWHTFKVGDKLYLFNKYPVGTAIKVTGNKIVFA